MARGTLCYNETGTSLSSVWMWMDEWNTDPNNYQSVFRSNTTLLKLDTSPGRYFSSNGTAEVVNAHGLVTGLTPGGLSHIRRGSPDISTPRSSSDHHNGNYGPSGSDREIREPNHLGKFWKLQHLGQDAIFIQRSDSPIQCNHKPSNGSYARKLQSNN